MSCPDDNGWATDADINALEASFGRSADHVDQFSDGVTEVVRLFDGIDGRTDECVDHRFGCADREGQNHSADHIAGHINATERIVAALDAEIDRERLTRSTSS